MTEPEVPRADAASAHRMRESMNTIDILRCGAERLVLETHLTPDQCADVVRWHDELRLDVCGHSPADRLVLRRVDRRALAKEVADVLAQCEVTIRALGLSREFIEARAEIKVQQMAEWEDMFSPDAA